MFFRALLFLVLSFAASWSSCFSMLAADTLKREHQQQRPNVLVIITDDQGYGDFGFNGNTRVQTPNLDRLARESVRCKYFYVSPVCAPTRASLMTGRYNYRTGVVDTYLGRATMFLDEVTLAEMFRDAGYRTGIFGKWHLGDNYPMRPMDQGFEESLVHKGGGIAQPSDPPGGDSYFDPTLYRNGVGVKSKGYCTEVFTDAAIEFIGRRERPFFAWLAYNAPHAPLQVPEADLAPYRDVGDEVTRKIYAMVSNVDRNIGRLLQHVPPDTIVVFLTDNGPQQQRYNGGLRDRKGSVYDGGIRVPFLIRWPGILQSGREVEQIAAHIDLAPTLLEACAIPKPAKVRFDGASLWPLLAGSRVQWPQRTLFFQWHRGDVPDFQRAFAVRGPRFKLAQPLGAGEKWDGKESFQLFDMQTDPAEQHDLAADRPEIVKEMLEDYKRWFADVKRSRGFASPRIVVGTTNENPTILTRQDWRGPQANWTTNGSGHWDVEIARSGPYRMEALFPALQMPATIELRCQNRVVRRDAAAGSDKCDFGAVNLKRGKAQIEASIGTATGRRGAHYVVLEAQLGKVPN